MTGDGKAASEEREQPRSILRSSIWQRPETRAHAELVWDADVATVKSIVAGSDQAAKAEPARSDTVDGTDDAIAAEVGERRKEELERLEAEISARRLELSRDLERQRASAEERIAMAERLERDAMTRWHEQAERLWQVDQPRMLAERIDAALAAELGDMRHPYAQAYARMREHLAARRREELARLEVWRASERERIERELATEEQRFNARLLGQLKEFEFQLAERLREQEERLARCWDEIEKQARQGMASLVDGALFGEKTPGDAGANTE